MNTSDKDDFLFPFPGAYFFTLISHLDERSEVLLSLSSPGTLGANDEVLRGDRHVQIMKQGKIPFCSSVWATVALPKAAGGGQG